MKKDPPFDNDMFFLQAEADFAMKRLALCACCSLDVRPLVEPEGSQVLGSGR